MWLKSNKTTRIWMPMPSFLNDKIRTLSGDGKHFLLFGFIHSVAFIFKACPLTTQNVIIVKVENYQLSIICCYCFFLVIFLIRSDLKFVLKPLHCQKCWSNCDFVVMCLLLSASVFSSHMFIKYMFSFVFFDVMRICGDVVVAVITIVRHKMVEVSW